MSKKAGNACACFREVATHVPSFQLSHNYRQMDEWTEAHRAFQFMMKQQKKMANT